MRQFFSTLIAASFILALAHPVTAHDRRYPSRVYDEQAVAGAVIAGILGGLAAGAIMNNGHHYHREPSRVRQYRPYYQRGYVNQRPHGTWVDKWQYEHNTGRGCPGRIDYWDGNYWCRIR